MPQVDYVQPTDMMRLKRPLTAQTIAVALAIVAAIATTAGCAPGDSQASETPTSTERSGTAGGVAAPEFSAETYDHGTFNLADVTGRPVVINFWFPSCPPCAAEMPDIQAAYERYGNDVVFIGVQQDSIIDTPEDGREFLSSNGITYPNIFDENNPVMRSYGVFNYPTTVFLDRDHNIHRTWMGLISKKNLEEQIAAILGG